MAKAKYRKHKDLLGLLTVTDLAVELQVQPKTLYGWIYQNRFPEPQTKINGSRRAYYSPSEVADVLAKFKEEVK
jgi:predicted DNA-binding transcriptional regulator AlpA